MNKITFSGKIDGVSVEQMVRFQQFNMKAKHFHNQYEIFYIIEGERLFFFNNRQYRAKSGDLILIDTNQIHMTTSVSSDDHGYNRVILYIDYKKMQEYDKQYPDLQLIRYFHDNYGVYHLTEDQQRDFLMLYHDLRVFMTKKKRNYEIGINLNILAWLHKLTDQLSHHETNLPASSDSTRYKTVYAVADYLSENCEKKISLDALAEHFFLSKYYLCRIFKEVTNYKITEYVNIHRIKKATHLLENTSLSISEISTQLGFESLTYFEKIFKTYKVLPPLHYRKTQNFVVPLEKLNILDDTTFLSR